MDVIETPFSSVLSFWVKTSTESTQNKLEFYMDGELKDEWSHSTPWTLKNISIENGGIHTFEWKYMKTNEVSGDDSVWIDYLIFPPIQQLSANAGANSAICEGNTHQLDGIATNYTSLE